MNYRLYFGQKQPFELETSYDGFVFYKHASLHFKIWIDGLDYLWIIVMFLSAVWTLILMAPIHCRGSSHTGVCQQLFSFFRGTVTLDTTHMLHAHFVDCNWSLWSVYFPLQRPWCTVEACWANMGSGRSTAHYWDRAGPSNHCPDTWSECQLQRVFMCVCVFVF